MSNVFFKRSGGTEGYFGNASHTLLHRWSLSVEQQFYLFFPITLLFDIDTVFIGFLPSTAPQLCPSVDGKCVGKISDEEAVRRLLDKVVSVPAFSFFQ